MIKKGLEFWKVYIVGTQRVSQQVDRAELTAIEILELFRVPDFLLKPNLV